MGGGKIWLLLLTLKYMANKFEMPPENMGNKPEKSDVKKAVSAEEFWETYRKDDTRRAVDHGDENPREAMERINKEVEATAARRAESIREITDGIKRRLNDWGREDLYKLDRHLGVMVNSMNLTFDQSFNELVAKCEEGTETGRVWRDENGKERTRISRNPDVASRALIDRLPWVINHDDVGLEVQAGKVISLGELRDLVKEVLKG